MTSVSSPEKGSISESRSEATQDCIVSSTPAKGQAWVSAHCIEIQGAFSRDMNNLGELEISKEDPAKDISDLAKETLMNVTNFCSPGPISLVGMKNDVISELQTSIYFKAFLAASTMSEFCFFFPHLSRHFSQFRRGNQTIARALFAGVPCLSSHSSLNQSSRKDLSHVLEIVVQLCRDVENSGMAEDTYFKNLSKFQKLTPKDENVLSNTEQPTVDVIVNHNDTEHSEQPKIKIPVGRDDRNGTTSDLQSFTCRENKEAYVVLDDTRYTICGDKDTHYLQNFICATNYGISFTHKKELLSDYQPMGTLTMINLSGKIHSVPGKGTIFIGGHTLTCNWIPTTSISILNINDFLKLGEHLLIYSNGDVYVSNILLRTLNYIGKVDEKKLVNCHEETPDDVHETRSKHNEAKRYENRHANATFTMENIPKQPGVHIKETQNQNEDKRSIDVTNLTRLLKNVALQPLFRLHWESAGVFGQRSIAFLTDEYTSHVWMVDGDSRESLFGKTKSTIQNIMIEFPSFECGFVTNEYGLNIPTPQFLNVREVHDLGLLAKDSESKIPFKTKKSLFFRKANRLLRRATSHDLLGQLLSLSALNYVLLTHNLTPPPNGRVPYDMLRSTWLATTKSFAPFGCDALVRVEPKINVTATLVPGADEVIRAMTQNTEDLNNNRLNGIYIGSHQSNIDLHLIWINFDTPGQKMNVIQARIVEFNESFNNIKIAGNGILRIQKRLLKRHMYLSPVPSKYSNLKVNSFQDLGIENKAEIMVIDPSYNVVATFPNTTLNNKSHSSLDDFRNFRLDILVQDGIKSFKGQLNGMIDGNQDNTASDTDDPHPSQALFNKIETDSMRNRKYLRYRGFDPRTTFNPVNTDSGYTESMFAAKKVFVTSNKFDGTARSSNSENIFSASLKHPPKYSFATSGSTPETASNIHDPAVVFKQTTLFNPTTHGTSVFGANTANSSSFGQTPNFKNLFKTDCGLKGDMKEQTTLFGKNTENKSTLLFQKLLKNGPDVKSEDGKGHLSFSFCSGSGSSDPKFQFPKISGSKEDLKRLEVFDFRLPSKPSESDYPKGNLFGSGGNIKSALPGEFTFTSQNTTYVSNKNGAFATRR
ncbi:hypothetical protein METBIDRAFT_12186 [Metschnikowia bicuspidata var. bicuspidata NRRL YB-4993]|uniref:Uncharacterized protein n=1 Tax=Metschnikowia bicuspidata var. bicuspidata NRRL YB-4993 TaxID=869754 RepID=A0A1A0HCI8_9ASCO|nr:hypothetical protein METBIDRAFT_12186 [Metschnikowia bicuspidata var. bicuspidata NRRL YB-4993]OBA21710.1 hypothetical protein METBIDRAFT_12186 [Metschnikowia bicuspidata var. bicuspidata NRRL YB-4993]